MGVVTRENLATDPQLGDDHDVNRDVVIRLRLTPVERDAWNTAAKKAGLKLSEWIRRRCQGEVTIVPPPPPGISMTGKRVPRRHPRRKTSSSPGPREPK